MKVSYGYYFLDKANVYASDTSTADLTLVCSRNSVSNEREEILLNFCYNLASQKKRVLYLASKYYTDVARFRINNDKQDNIKVLSLVDYEYSLDEVISKLKSSLGDYDYLVLASASELDELSYLYASQKYRLYLETSNRHSEINELDFIENSYRYALKLFTNKLKDLGIKVIVSCSLLPLGIDLEPDYSPKELYILGDNFSRCFVVHRSEFEPEGIVHVELAKDTLKSFLGHTTLIKQDGSFSEE